MAEVKAMKIRTQRDVRNAEQRSQDYEQKAVLLLKKAETGDLAASEADRLATEALNRKERADQEVSRLHGEQQRYEASVNKLESNVDVLKSNISTWENELKNLEARMKVSSATKSINKQMTSIDASNTTALLERMKSKWKPKKRWPNRTVRSRMGQKTWTRKLRKPWATAIIRRLRRNYWN